MPSCWLLTTSWDDYIKLIINQSILILLEVPFALVYNSTHQHSLTPYCGGGLPLWTIKKTMTPKKQTEGCKRGSTKVLDSIECEAHLIFYPGREFK